MMNIFDMCDHSKSSGSKRSKFFFGFSFYLSYSFIRSSISMFQAGFSSFFFSFLSYFSTSSSRLITKLSLFADSWLGGRSSSLKGSSDFIYSQFEIGYHSSSGSSAFTSSGLTSGSYSISGSSTRGSTFTSSGSNYTSGKIYSSSG